MVGGTLRSPDGHLVRLRHLDEHAPARAAGQLTFGTVLDDGEDVGSERVLTAAGHAAAVVHHRSYELGRARDAAWVDDIERVPADVRHLALHDRHLVGVTERDRPFITGDLIRRFSTTGSAAEVRERIAAAAAAGVTEIAYQPAGPDIPRELRTFRDATEAAVRG